MRKNPRLHVDPSGLVLVEETTAQGFKEWLIERMGGRRDLPASVFDRMNASDPEAAIRPLLDEISPGDTL